MSDFEVVSLDVSKMTDEEVLHYARNSSSKILQRMAEITEDLVSGAYDDGYHVGYTEGYYADRFREGK